MFYRGSTLKHWLTVILVLCIHSSFALAEERLVVAGGSLTEIVYALGAESQIVGVDSSSNYPNAVHRLPDVGYYRTLNVEGLLSVSPSKVLMLNGSGPQSVLAQLDALGVERVMVENPKTIEGLMKMIEQVATATDRVEQGHALRMSLQQQLDDINNMGELRGKSAVFLMSAGERGLIAAGSNTTPQLIFDNLNVDNPFVSLQGFQPISAESLAQSAPDIILVASHTTRGLSAESLCESAQLMLWAKQKGCNLVKIDSLKYLGLTPRLPEAIVETRQLLE
jgi:iron complex transport system substrate-binding protein